MQLQKKSRKNSAFAQYKSLSIQFSLDGFSFCIRNSETQELLVFTDYAFKKSVSSPELLLSNLINIFKNDKDLQQDFKTVFAIHQNSLNSLVPNPYFDRNNMAPYLKYSVKTLATDYITYDNILKIDANNVYIPYVNINNYLFQNFGEFEFKHHSTVLIEKLMNYEHTSEKSFFVSVNPNYIDIVVCNKEQLFLYNSFNYTTKEDFIYYILFVAEQLDLNPDEFTLNFLGQINETSDVYKIAYKYIRNISFINIESTFFNDSNEFLNHAHYTLVS